jgi:hypothetical protein
MAEGIRSVQFALPSAFGSSWSYRIAVNLRSMAPGGKVGVVGF